LESRSFDWPPIKGDYSLGERSSPCAVAIVGRGVVDVPPDLYSIIGRFKTENMGIEKIVMNIISNPRIRFLIVCGKEEFGHFPGDAILNFAKEGLGEDMRIKGTRAAIPFLCNLTPVAIDRFREQVEVIDLIHPKEAGEIIEYDPIYFFEKESRDELVERLKECNSMDPGTFEADPIIITSEGLDYEGEDIGNRMNRLADHFTNQMLRMPSQKLSTSSSIAVVSEEFRIILDPIDMEVIEVPSVDLARKLKSYLTGRDV
jgi:tetrahydromethanopterin S-methyltransferase subunit A